MNQAVQFKLESLHLGTPQIFKNLAIIPLFDETPPAFDYLSLKTALEQGLAVVTEVSEGGSVPELKVFNKAPQPILIIDGEELIGAKQNRIVNTTILLKPESETLIPVSCTEAGRWRYASHAFASSDHMMFASARMAKSARVVANKMAYDRYDAEQGRVWNDISHFHTANRTSSATSAMSDSYEQRQDDLSDYIAAFPLQDNQKGLIALVNGKPWAADFVSDAVGYADLHGKLVKSFAADCLSRPVKPLQTEENLSIDAWKSLQNLVNCKELVVQPVGLGEDVRYDSPEQGAAALVYLDSVVHLTVYQKNNIETDTPSDFQVGENLHRSRFF